MQGDGYWDRYLAFLDQYLVKIDNLLALALLAGFPIPKAWVNARALLGSKNDLTSLIRGLALLGMPIPFAKEIGRVAVWPAVIIMFAIGIYNFTIMLEGLIYAAVRLGPESDRIASGRDRNRISRYQAVV